MGNIRTIMFKFQYTKYPTHAIHNYKRFLYTYRQERVTLAP